MPVLFRLGIQPAKSYESLLLQVLCIQHRDMTFDPVVPFRCRDGASRFLKQQVER